VSPQQQEIKTREQMAAVVVVASILYNLQNRQIWGLNCHEIGVGMKIRIDMDSGLIRKSRQVQELGFAQEIIFINKILTSIPACRKNQCAEKNNRYFDFEHFKIYAHFNISYNF
jgi:hypothetical protein